jgi:hypothetical protein
MSDSKDADVSTCAAGLSQYTIGRWARDISYLCEKKFLTFGVKKFMLDAQEVDFDF